MRTVFVEFIYLCSVKCDNKTNFVTMLSSNQLRSSLLFTF